MSFLRKSKKIDFFEILNEKKHFFLIFLNKILSKKFKFHSKILIFKFD